MWPPMLGTYSMYCDTYCWLELNGKCPLRHEENQSLGWVLSSVTDLGACCCLLAYCWCTVKWALILVDFFFFFGLNTFENIWQTLQCRNLTYSIYTCVLEVTQDNIPNQVKTETLRHSSETQTVWVSFTSSHPACYGWENQKSALPAEDFFPHPLILPRFLFLLDGAVLSSDFPQILLSTVVLGSPLATFRSRARRCNLSTSTSQIV